VITGHISGNDEGIVEIIAMGFGGQRQPLVRESFLAPTLSGILS